MDVCFKVKYFYTAIKMYAYGMILGLDNFGSHESGSHGSYHRNCQVMELFYIYVHIAFSDRHTCIHTYIHIRI